MGWHYELDEKGNEILVPDDYGQGYEIQTLSGEGSPDDPVSDPTPRPPSGPAAPPAAPARPKTQQELYDEWIKAHPGDEERARDALGFGPVQGKYGTYSDVKAFGAGTASGDPGYNRRQANYERHTNWDQIEAELRADALAKGTQYDRSDLEGIKRNAGYDAAHQGASGGYVSALEKSIANAKANYSKRSDNAPGGGAAAPSPAPSPAPRPATLGAVVPPPAAVTQPYSARMTSPVTTALPVAAAPSSVPMSEAGMPTARQTATMGNMLSSPSPSVGQNPYAFQTAQGVRGQNPYAFQVPQSSQGQDAENPYAADRQFGYTNDVYDRSLQGTGFARAPWASTRDQLARGPMAASPMDASTGMPNNRDRRRAYQFGAQDAANNQRDAMLGQQDFNGQMNNWLKAYNDWNRRGADPLAPPTGGV